MTTYLQLVLMERIRGSIHPLPHASAGRSAYILKHKETLHFITSLTLNVKTGITAI